MVRSAHWPLYEIINVNFIKPGGLVGNGTRDKRFVLVRQLANAKSTKLAQSCKKVKENSPTCASNIPVQGREYRVFYQTSYNL